MRKLFDLTGALMAASLDVAMGMFIVAIAHTLEGTTPTYLELALGSALATLPDFDIFIPIVTGSAIRRNHRHTPFHRPLFVLPPVACAAWLLGGWFAASWATVCVLWHFIHDTEPLSKGGIAWLYPFSKKYWALRGTRDPDPEPVQSWQKGVAEHWLVRTKLSSRELWAAALLSGATIGLVYSDIVLGLLVAAVCIGAALLVWRIYARFRAAAAT